MLLFCPCNERTLSKQVRNSQVRLQVCICIQLQWLGMIRQVTAAYTNGKNRNEGV